MADWLPIVILAGLATLFALVSVVLASLVGPNNPSVAKNAPYECGITPVRLPWGDRFPVKFYQVAMLFIIFDVEIVFFYPWAAVFRELRLFGLAEMGLFVLLLFVAYIYIFRQGALGWQEAERRVVRPRGALVSNPAALRSPGEGGPAFWSPSRPGASSEDPVHQEEVND